jgi:MoaA/NifB/PqqE/SkfB family radical SAM enzyme
MTPRQYAGFAYHALRMNAQKSHRIPLTVNVQLLLKCPFACLYCPQDHHADDRLSLEVLRGVFRDARELGGQRIHLTGGEPLLRDDLEDIIRSARESGFFVSLTTSGARVERQLNALKLLDQVQLSFDGPADIRGLLRGDAAAVTAQKAIDVFKANGLHFWTSTVLTRANMSQIDWVVDHARQHGIQANFVLMEAHPEDWNEKNPMPEATRALFPTPEENRQAVRRLMKLKRQGAPIGSSMPYLEELAEWKDYSRLTSPEPSSRYRCMAPQSQCEILANGDLHICDWTLQRGAGVSVIEHGFRGAFERLPTPSNCNSCYSACYLETNLMFSLNPRTVFNWASRLMWHGAMRNGRSPR